MLSMYALIPCATIVYSIFNTPVIQYHDAFFCDPGTSELRKPNLDLNLIDDCEPFYFMHSLGYSFFVNSLLFNKD